MAFYNVGTASVTASSATVTGSGTLWTANLEAEDNLSIGGLSVPILEIVSDTEITLVYPWPGTTQSGADYVVMFTSPNRYDAAFTQKKVRQVLDAIIAANLFLYTDGAPSSGIGADGNWALDPLTTNLYQKAGGLWAMQGNLISTEWINGSSDPTGGTGKLGDFFLNTTSSKWFKKTGSTTWTEQGIFLQHDSTPSSNSLSYWDHDEQAFDWAELGVGLNFAAGVLSLSFLGLETLSGPPGDRLLGWDDAAEKLGWINFGDGLDYTTGVLSVIDATTTDAGIIRIATETEAVDEGTSETTAITPATLWAAVEAMEQYRRDNLPRFFAHKNSVDQTGIVPSTQTKVTFNSEKFDVGGYFDAANSQWVPPAGPVRMVAMIRVSANAVNNEAIAVSIWKNGSTIASSSGNADGTNSTNGNMVTVLDNADGTDVYEVFVNLGGTGNKTLNGAANVTNFQGEMLC